MFNSIQEKMDSILPPPKFTELNDLCSNHTGGKILFATDDYFAVAENMLLDTAPIFIPEKYTDCGKWMDGWETRRKRKAGHDWCIIKLATKSVIYGVDVDTAFFTGNYTPKYSIQAACLTAEEEELIPSRKSEMGSECTVEELDKVDRVHSGNWQEIIPITALRPGYEATRHNYQKVITDESFTHLRVNMFPDGGIARLRVFGVARPEGGVPCILDGQCMIDLLEMRNGGVCQGYSNAHYGHPRNLIKPERGVNMGDGWETARRLDRPEIIHTNDDGTLRVPGSEWAVFKLGQHGVITKICVDTCHFKGNFPDSVKIEGTFLHTTDWISEASEAKWITIQPTSKLSANSEHWYDCFVEKKLTHVRISMAPDGGISRVRLYSPLFVNQSSIKLI